MFAYCLKAYLKSAPFSAGVLPAAIVLKIASYSAGVLPAAILLKSVDIA